MTTNDHHGADPTDQVPAHPAETTDPEDPADDGLWSGDGASQTDDQTAETSRTSSTGHPAGDPTMRDER